MNELSLHVSARALEFLKRKIASSGISSPVVLFVGQGARRKLNPEVGRALRAGADEATLQKLFMKFHAHEIPMKDWQVASRVLSREDLPVGSLFEIAGIAFVLWPSLAAKLDGGSVEFDEGHGFALTDRDGNAVLPFDDDQAPHRVRGDQGP